jgi:serine/threonine-protein kinase HipA
MHALANLVHADFRLPSLDYLDLLKVTSALTRDRREVVRALALMVFNVVMHNRDDHGKNFAFLMDTAGQWTLAPAYDLTFSPGPGTEHSTTVAGEGARPTREHCLQVATTMGLKLAEAGEIIQRVNDTASAWSTVAKDAGVSAASMKLIQKSIRPL